MQLQPPTLEELLKGDARHNPCGIKVIFRERSMMKYISAIMNRYMSEVQGGLESLHQDAVYLGDDLTFHILERDESAIFVSGLASGESRSYQYIGIKVLLQASM